jgi:uncharacterized membrane protein
MTRDGEEEPMAAPVEDRLQSLEDRVRTLEALVRAGVAAPEAPSMPAPAGPPAMRSPATRKPSASRAPAPPPRAPLDLEELLGGRVLAWVGGIAVLLAVVFFLVMAVHNGWIDEPTRAVLAFFGSTALLVAGVWLYERKGRTQAALATVGAALAALYASDTTVTAVYHLVSPAVGLCLAGLVGIAATAIAVRWSSQVVAGIGIVGALLGPVLVGAGTGTASLAFMTIALVAAVAVLLWRRWSWLASLAYLVSAPQAADWLASERHAHLGPALAVTAAFWALYVVAALGYELRVPTRLRASSALLLLVNAAATAAGGWAMLHDAGNGLGATAWVVAVAAAHMLLAAGSFRGRVSREIAALLAAEAAALAAAGTALALDGPALVAGWTVEAIVLAWIARRVEDERGYLGSLAFLVLAAGHTVVFEAPLRALAYGVDSLPRAVAAVALVAAGAAALAAVLPRERRREAEALRGVAAGIAVYLGSVLVVDLAGARAGATTQTSQLALSAFWAALGFGSLVAGLVRDARPLRLAGFALLGLAVVKVFLVDLRALESVWRVASFLALGLLLLAGAFAYQRARSGIGRSRAL